MTQPHCTLRDTRDQCGNAGQVKLPLLASLESWAGFERYPHRFGTGSKQFLTCSGSWTAPNTSRRHSLTDRLWTKLRSGTIYSTRTHQQKVVSIHPRSLDLTNISKIFPLTTTDVESGDEDDEDLQATILPSPFALAERQNALCGLKGCCLHHFVFGTELHPYSSSDLFTSIEDQGNVEQEDKICSINERPYQILSL